MKNLLHDPVLGSLKWDESLRWWASCVQFSPALSIEITISCELEESGERILDRARSGFGMVRANEPKHRLWTANRVQGKRWNKEDEMSVETVAQALKLVSLHFCEDGRILLYWNDEDRFFGGHNLVTEVDADGHCYEFRVEG